MADLAISRRRSWKVALPVVLMLAGLRFVALTADSTLGPFWVFDEGHWAHNARNQVLFHRLMMDDFNQGLIAPVFSALTFISFELFGVGLLQARLVSVLIASLTLVLFYYWLESVWNRKDAAVATLLLGTNFQLYSYNRLAVPETTVVFFLVLAAFLWSRTDDRPSRGFAAAVAFIMACLSKPTAAFFFAVPFVVWLLKPSAAQRGLSLTERLGHLLRRPHRDALGSYLLGCAAIALAAVFTASILRLLPDYQDMGFLLAWGKRPDSLASLASGFVALPTKEFFRQVPDLLLLASLYVMMRCVGLAEGRPVLEQCSRTEIIALSWLGLGTLFVASTPHYADRYMVVLIPAFSVLGGKALSEVAAGPGAERVQALARAGRWPKALFVGAFFMPFLSIVWKALNFLIVPDSPLTTLAPMLLNIMEKLIVGCAVLAFIGVLAYLLWRRQNERSIMPFMLGAYPILVFSWALATGAIFLAGYAIPMGLSEGLSMATSGAVALPLIFGLALVFVRRYRDRRFRAAYHRGWALLLAAILLINGSQIASFLSHCTYDVMTAAAKLGPYLTSGTVILGDMADTLALDSKAQSIRGSYLGMNNNAFERFHPNYVLVYEQDAKADMRPPAPHGGRLLEGFCLLPLNRQRSWCSFVVNFYAVDTQSRSPAVEQ